MSSYHDAESLARLLGKPKRSGQGWECICPAHDDSNPSLWLVDGASGGQPRFHCRVGCQWEDISTAISSRGLSWKSSSSSPKESRYEKADRRKAERRRASVRAVISPVPADAPAPATVKVDGEHPTQIYEYRDAAGRLLRFVARIDRTDGKVIRPFVFVQRRDGGSGWAMGTPAEPRTLYGLEILVARPDDPVLLVEGEKSADAARRLFPSHAVVTWQGGANAIENSAWDPLHGREILIWPDADDAGREAATKIASKLNGLGVLARTVKTTDLPPKWDLADPIPEGLDIHERLGIAVHEPVPAAAARAERALVDFIITAADLVKMDLPHRQYLITPFISTNSLNMIYAERGLGKTWFSIFLALCLARGEDFLDYLVERPCPVLYIDGEMPLADLQGRVIALDPDPPATLMLLPSETLFREAKPLNLHNKEDQIAIEGAITTLVEREMGPAVVIFDNLSSLSGGVDENDNSALDTLLQWLLGLRHRGLAIILVHHAGKSGTQRGASRREDLLDTSIALVRPDKDDEEEPHPGAHFILTFPKTRGLPPDPREMELMLTEHKDRLQWQYSEKRKVDQAIELLKIIWETKPASQKEFAANLGKSTGRISQICGKLRRRKLLDVSPSLAVTLEGKEALIAVFPELEAVMLKQGELGFRNVI